MGDIGRAAGRTEIDATGLAVAPGFINMMCWANESLIVETRGPDETAGSIPTRSSANGIAAPSRLAADTIPSLAPRTGARSQPIRWTE